MTTAGQAESLFSRSCYAHPLRPSHNIPNILLLIGMRDRRVHPMQGIRWLHYLRSIPFANGARIECLVFPDENHQLEGIEAETTEFEQVVDFFLSSL